MLRRVAVIRAAQVLGLTLEEIGRELRQLLQARTPNGRIAGLESLRDRLSGCIGRGCLSLESCSLFNPDDRAANRGAGARYLIGDSPSA